MTVKDEKTPNDEPDIPFAEVLSTDNPSSVPPPATTTNTSTTVLPLAATPLAATPSSSGAAAGGSGGSGSGSGVYHVPNLGRQPKSITCPNCRKSIQTEIDPQVDAYSFVFCVILFLLFWPLFWLPFVLPPCKAVVHICPQCRKQLGKTPTCCG